MLRTALREIAHRSLKCSYGTNADRIDESLLGRLLIKYPVIGEDEHDQLLRKFSRSLRRRTDTATFCFYHTRLFAGLVGIRTNLSHVILTTRIVDVAERASVEQNLPLKRVKVYKDFFR